MLFQMAEFFIIENNREFVVRYMRYRNTHTFIANIFPKHGNDPKELLIIPPERGLPVRPELDNAEFLIGTYITKNKS